MTVRADRFPTVAEMRKYARDNAPAKRDIPGIYVAKLAMEGPYLAAELNLKANGKVFVRTANIDSGPSAASEGTWTYRDGVLLAQVEISGMPARLTLDLTRTTIDELKTEGRPAAATLDGDALPFRVNRLDRSFFRK